MSRFSLLSKLQLIPAKIIAPVVVLALAVLLVSALLWITPGVETQAVEKRLPPVEVTVATFENITLSISSEGIVEPSIEIDLAPEVSGRTSWISPHLVNGGSFRKDDPLLRIESRDYQYQLEQAAADKQRTEVELGIARKDHLRQKDLHSQGLISESKLDDAFKLLRLAEAADKSASAAKAQAALRLERAEIRAPFTGRVHSETVDVGQYVEAGRSIANLYSDQRVEIRLPISNIDMGYLDWPDDFRSNWPQDLVTPVTISSQYGGQSFSWQGQLIRMESEIDASTRLFYGVAQVDNQIEASQPPLAKGLFVRAKIGGRSYENIVVLPRTALRTGNRVLIVNEENQLFYREVDVLRVQDDDVLIAAGITSGETICISPLNVVVEGMSVHPMATLSQFPAED